jgi:hypothetical protein
MTKAKFAIQSRHIRVPHPNKPDVILFEAEVKIINLNLEYVKKIDGVKIEYKLKEKN